MDEDTKQVKFKSTKTQKRKSRNSEKNLKRRHSVDNFNNTSLKRRSVTLAEAKLVQKLGEEVVEQQNENAKAFERFTKIAAKHENDTDSSKKPTPRTKSTRLSPRKLARSSTAGRSGTQPHYLI
eukprot:TRINITY_DN3492_c0_g1_i2.p1 TRINITY_DN3492_c0_g1~~TRINITY_DN3492_c0_g1_i2.p1  ORF type:complete len:124 (-),score=21.71 TRINITY_DN3492_c0_g1_i2:550-921(-)